MATLTVRSELDGDRSSVRAVNDAAFGGPLEGSIVDAIRGTDRWIEGGSLVAETADGEVVGHLLLSAGDLLGNGEHVSRRIWVIGPVAVMPERQRGGVGSALMRRAIDVGTERGQPVLCLLGHAEYYRRFGFRPARALGLLPPHPWPDENWLALPLPAWTDTLRGTIRYPPAFPD